MRARGGVGPSWLPGFLAGPVLVAVLAASAAVVYLTVVVGAGKLIGTGGRPNLALSVVATAVVAVAFHPVRDRAHSLVHRLMYGDRASPYSVLARFSADVAGTYAIEDVVPRMARTLTEGTGAERAEIWLRVGGELRRAASWPPSVDVPEARPIVEQPLVDAHGADRVVPVRHHGELLGELVLTPGPAEPGDPAADRLLSDLASQAGLVLRNVQLTAELRARLEEISRQAGELRASRQRIVAAQDEQRRRLERNIHDGAQQHLVALAVKLRLARTFAERDVERARALLAELLTEAGEALEALRDLARGIYPPLLAEQGLVPALVAQFRKASIPVQVVGDGMGRHQPNVEAGVYFCCLESVQNALKHAKPSRVLVELGDADDALAFSISDDGVGFDPATVRSGTGLQSIADRVAALGGVLAVESSSAGTVVRGRIPLSSPPRDATPGRAARG